jgi:hypothetical protein
MTKRARISFSAKAIWRLGQIAQGLIMGGLLFYAILQLTGATGPITAFRYEAY